MIYPVQVFPKIVCFSKMTQSNVITSTVKSFSIGEYTTTIINNSFTISHFFLSVFDIFYDCLLKVLTIQVFLADGNQPIWGRITDYRFLHRYR
jgi:hypothetical protein